MTRTCDLQVRNTKPTQEVTRGYVSCSARACKERHWAAPATAPGSIRLQLLGLPGPRPDGLGPGRAVRVVVPISAPKAPMVPPNRRECVGPGVSEERTPHGPTPRTPQLPGPPESINCCTVASVSVGTGNAWPSPYSSANRKTVESQPTKIAAVTSVSKVAMRCLLALGGILTRRSQLRCEPVHRSLRCQSPGSAGIRRDERTGGVDPPTRPGPCRNRPLITRAFFRLMYTIQCSTSIPAA